LSTLIRRREGLKYIAWNRDTGPLNRRIKEERRERLTSYSDHKEQQSEDVVWIDLIKKKKIFKVCFFCNFSRFCGIIHWHKIYKYWCAALP